VRRTKFRKLHEIDLIGETPEIDAYEARLVELIKEKEIARASKEGAGLRLRGSRLKDRVGLVFC